MAPSGDNVSAGYAAQLSDLRSVTKWLLTAAAGVGILLMAGVSISGIGRLPLWSWRLFVAAGAAVLALGAVGYILREVSVVLTHEWLTLASFGDESTREAFRGKYSSWRSVQLRQIDEKLAVSRHELFGYAAQSRAQLHARLREADERLWQCEPGSNAAVKCQREAAVLRKAARDTVQYANYYYTLRLFQRMRVRVAWAALPIAVGIAAYAYAVSAPRI
jgi:hypothetical protein